MKPKSDIDAFARPSKLKVKRLERWQYRAYIQSDEWRELRKNYWKQCKVKECKGCGVSGVTLDLHHRTYKNLGREFFTDLIPLCRTCHEKVHEITIKGKRSLWRATKKVTKRLKIKRRKAARIKSTLQSLTWPPSRQGALKSPRLSP